LENSPLLIIVGQIETFKERNDPWLKTEEKQLVEKLLEKQNFDEEDNNSARILKWPVVVKTRRK
jgi:hypothetical protein